MERGGFLSEMNSMFVEQVWLLADALRCRDRRGDGQHQGPLRPSRITRCSTGCSARAAQRGQRWNWVGRRRGEAKVEIETLWTVGNEYPEHWPHPEEHGWTLTIESDPSMLTHFLALASFSRPATIAEHAWLKPPTSLPQCRCSTLSPP